MIEKDTTSTAKPFDQVVKEAKLNYKLKREVEEAQAKHKATMYENEYDNFHSLKSICEDSGIGYREGILC